MNLFNIIKIKNTKYLFLLAFLVCNTSLHAHPFLLEVTGDHSFYLFGTIHLPDPRVTSLPVEVEEALKNSTSFYAELDLSEANTMEITQAMWLSEKQMLHALLPEELKFKINDYLKGINPELNLELFSKQKIWVLAVTLTVLEQQLKFPGQPPLDRALYEKALNLGLHTGGLESVQDQLGIFEKMTQQEQIVFLSDTLEHLLKNKKNNSDFIEKSIHAYLAGDLDSLMSHLMSYMKDNKFYDDLMYQLVDIRNIRMTEKMLTLVAENPSQKYFFAVGAGHFWKENSINQLLLNKGYSIQVIN